MSKFLGFALAFVLAFAVGCSQDVKVTQFKKLPPASDDFATLSLDNQQTVSALAMSAMDGEVLDAEGTRLVNHYFPSIEVKAAPVAAEEPAKEELTPEQKQAKADEIIEKSFDEIDARYPELVKKYFGE